MSFFRPNFRTKNALEIGGMEVEVFGHLFGLPTDQLEKLQSPKK
jgi:hypothetical protein